MLKKSAKQSSPIAVIRAPTRSVKKIAFNGSYTLRKCGIATFTGGLRRAVAARRVLLTFDLLSPPKGMKRVLEAQPAIIANLSETRTDHPVAVSAYATRFASVSIDTVFTARG